MGPCSLQLTYMTSFRCLNLIYLSTYASWFYLEEDIVESENQYSRDEYALSRKKKLPICSHFLVIYSCLFEK